MRSSCGGGLKARKSYSVISGTMAIIDLYVVLDS